MTVHAGSCCRSGTQACRRRIRVRRRWRTEMPIVQSHALGIRHGMVSHFMTLSFMTFLSQKKDMCSDGQYVYAHHVFNSKTMGECQRQRIYSSLACAAATLWCRIHPNERHFPPVIRVCKIRMRQKGWWRPPAAYVTVGSCDAIPGHVSVMSGINA